MIAASNRQKLRFLRVAFADLCAHLEVTDEVLAQAASDPRALREARATLDLDRRGLLQRGTEGTEEGSP